MITEARFQALAKALAHLIKALPPPKTVKGKTERTALLQDLTNSARPLRSAMEQPAPFAASRQQQQPPPDAPAGPTPLEVRYADPPRSSEVRPGTVVGVPRQVDPNKSW